MQSSAQNIGILEPAVNVQDTDKIIIRQGAEPGCKKNFGLTLGDLRTYTGVTGGGGANVPDTIYTKAIVGKYPYLDPAGHVKMCPDSSGQNNFTTLSHGKYENVGKDELGNYYYNTLETANGAKAKIGNGNDSTEMLLLVKNAYSGDTSNAPYVSFISKKFGAQNKQSELRFEYDTTLWNITAQRMINNVITDSDSIVVNGVTFTKDGKISAPNGIDPPYISFTNETRSSIVDKYADKCKDPIMFFYNVDNQRFEIYDKRTKKFKKA